MPNIEESNVAFVRVWPPPKKKQRVNSSSGSFHVVSAQRGISGPRASSETTSVVPADRVPDDLDAAPRATKKMRDSQAAQVGDATDRRLTPRFTSVPDKGFACPWNNAVPFDSRDPAMVRAIPLPSGKYMRRSVCKVDSPVMPKNKEKRRHTLPHFKESKSTCELGPFHRPNVEERTITSESGPQRLPSGKEEICAMSEGGSMHLPRCDKGEETGTNGLNPLCLTENKGRNLVSDWNQLSVPNDNAERKSASKGHPRQSFCDVGAMNSASEWGSPQVLNDSDERINASVSDPLHLHRIKERESYGECHPSPVPVDKEGRRSIGECDTPHLTNFKKRKRESTSEGDSPQVPNVKEVKESTDESNLRQPPNVKERTSMGEYDPPCLPKDKEVRKSTSKCDVQHSPYVGDVGSSRYVSLCSSNGKQDRKSAYEGGSPYWSSGKVHRKRKIELGPLYLPSEKEERTSTSPYDPIYWPTEKEERKNASKSDPLQSLHDKEEIDTSSESGSSQCSKDKDERLNTSGLDSVYLFSGTEERKSNGGKGSSHFPREKVQRKIANRWDSPDVKERRSNKKCQSPPVFKERKSTFEQFQPHLPYFNQRMSASGFGSPHLSHVTEERKSASKWSPSVFDERKGAMECGSPRLPNFQERMSPGELGRLPPSPNYAAREEGTSYTNSFINETPDYEHSIFQDVEFIGDSMLLRLFTHITGMKPTPSKQPEKAWYKLTVGGQTLAQSLKKLKCLKSRDQLPTTKRIIVMLGTNNILNNTQLNEMKWQLRQIVHMLTVQCSNVIVLTIPPIPRLDNTRNPMAWKRLCAYNLFIRQELEGEKVSIMDIFPLFMDNEEVRKHLFERFMGYGIYKRPDEIHWNLEGITVVHKAICNAGLL